MATIQDYIDLITSRHADKPKFLATVSASVEGLVAAQNLMSGMSGSDFDLDDAEGVQLDQIGLWVGVGRSVKTPLAGVYFSFDIVGLGFDQGVWQGPFDPDSGVIVLDDSTYRLVLRAKIASNNWDGTMEGTRAVLEIIIPPSSGTFIFVEDNQDMTMTVGVAGLPLTPIQSALLTGGYISVKPQTVRIKYYATPSVPGPLFGFDVSNSNIAGFDVGNWASIIAP
jgi:hypothetical protein